MLKMVHQRASHVGFFSSALSPRTPVSLVRGLAVGSSAATNSLRSNSTATEAHDPQKTPKSNCNSPTLCQECTQASELSVLECVLTCGNFRRGLCGTRTHWKHNFNKAAQGKVERDSTVSIRGKIESKTWSEHVR